MTLFLQYLFPALQRFANKLNGCTSAHVVRSFSCHHLIALLIWTVRVKPFSCFIGTDVNHGHNVLGKALLSSSLSSSSSTGWDCFNLVDNLETPYL